MMKRKIRKTGKIFRVLYTVIQSGSVPTKKCLQNFQYFYSIKEIEMGGRCVCNGHAKTCDILDRNRPTRLLCRCEHNSCGDQCEKCCPGFEQKKWQPNRDRQTFQCERNICFCLFFPWTIYVTVFC